MEKEEKVTIRLTGTLRRALQRGADEAGIKLSEHMRRLFLVIPTIAASNDVPRIQASAQKAGATRSDSVPCLVNVQRRLDERFQALQGLKALTTHWREAAAQELQAAAQELQAAAQELQAAAQELRGVKISYAQSTIRVPAMERDQIAATEIATIAITRKNDLERQKGNYAGSSEHSDGGPD